MGSVNKVIIVGNLGADPEVKYTPTGKAVCNLSVATNEVWKDKVGQKQEKTEWHRVAVWGDQAEHCSKYLAKGRMCYIEGKLQTRTYEDKAGAKKYATEIMAERVVFLGGGSGESSSPSGGKPRGERSAPPPSPDPAPADDSDIPF